MMRRFRIKISETNKKYLISFSIFFGIIFGLTVILVTFTLLSRSSWKSALALDMQKVLDSYQPDSYTVGDYRSVESMLSASSVVYSLKKNSPRSESCYGVMVRIPSLLGPLPAVFIYSEVEGVSFAGYAVDNGKAGATVAVRLESDVMKYWEALIPKIIARTEKK